MGGGSTLRPAAPASPMRPRAGSFAQLSASSSSSSSLSFPAPSSAPASLTDGRARPCPLFVGEERRVPLEEFHDGEEGSPNCWIGFCDRPAFGPVPSEEEAEAALSALRQVFGPLTFCYSKDGLPSSMDKDAVDKSPVSFELRTSAEHESESADGDRQPNVSQSLELNSSHTLQSQGLSKLCSSFHLLQLDSSIQKIIVSLSTDKAVWDAVMRNDAVQELKQCFMAVGTSETKIEAVDIVKAILGWILQNTTRKIIELIERITGTVNNLFHPRESGESWDLLSDVIRSSFMLSVMVLIVVIVSRIQG